MEELCKNSAEVVWTCDGCGKIMEAQAEFKTLPNPSKSNEPIVKVEGYKPHPGTTIRIQITEGRETVRKACGQECARNMYLVLGLQQAFAELAAAIKKSK